MKKDAQELLELVFLDPYQVNGVLVVPAFCNAGVSYGEKEHVPERDGFGFERLARDLEQAVLHLDFF